MATSARERGRPEMGALLARGEDSFARTWWYDALTAVLSTWLVAGLFADGWAHLNIPTQETFFSPWHILLYSGFLATAAWILWPVARLRAQGQPWSRAVPPGYGVAVIGVFVFFAGGLLDMAWHSLRGFEKNLETVTAPGHLMIFTGGILVVTAPFRAAQGNIAWQGEAPSLRRFFPALLSLILAVSVCSFFLMYLWPFLTSDALQPSLRYLSRFTNVQNQRLLLELSQARGISGTLIFNLVLLAPVLVMLRRWQLPFGAITIFFVVVIGLMAVLTLFKQPEALIVAAGAGVFGDVLAHRLRVTPATIGRFRLFSLFVPVVLWSLYFGVEHWRWGIYWRLEMWGGLIMWTGLSGLALGVIMTQQPTTIGRQEEASDNRCAPEAYTIGEAQSRRSRVPSSPL